MSTIRLSLPFEGSQGAREIKTLFDTGATFSCIHPDFVKGLATPEKLYKPMEAATAAANQFLKIDFRISADFYINGVRLSDEFYIVPNLSEEAILGVNTFQKWRIKFDFEHDQVMVDPKVAKAQLK